MQMKINKIANIINYKFTGQRQMPLTQGTKLTHSLLAPQVSYVPFRQIFFKAPCDEHNRLPLH